MSSDAPVGIAFNIPSYALLTHLLAHVLGYEPGEFIHINGDYHIYTNQLDLVKVQLAREPYPLPRLWLNPDKRDIYTFAEEDIRLEDYRYHPAIHYPVAV